ncbi:unnamed protein product [Caenorhabditis angaria]|uniref:Dehydrogenase/reductase SDR family member 1 n=1 Tax=Caenorhabditis angaria TaxID=860376 RepID=A0A9P1NBS1_9PELO|nr:unnamed protein product [Caenorhabditis angaria]
MNSIVPVAICDSKVSVSNSSPLLINLKNAPIPIIFPPFKTIPIPICIKIKRVCVTFNRKSSSSLHYLKPVLITLKGKVAIVTGASRGVGKGIALQLCQAGCTVFITGRRPENSASSQVSFLSSLEETAKECRDRGGECYPYYVDHSKMDEVEQFFKDVAEKTNNQLDILVNNAFSAVSQCGTGDNSRFFERDPKLWDDVNNVGLRNHYYCSVYAARIMIQNPIVPCLIVNISSVGGGVYLFNTCYGVGKCAKDRMAHDMGHELQNTNITVISLWPGAVKTELITNLIKNKDESFGEAQNEMFMNGETTEYPGKAIVHLAKDSNMKKWNSATIITADLGNYYGFRDIDGRKPANLRQVNAILALQGYTKLAKWTPNWLKFTGWQISMWLNKFKY